MSQKDVAKLREEYPQGARVMLLKKKKPSPQLRLGDMGNVLHIDGSGQIHVLWDNGSSLTLIPGSDKFMKLE